MARRAKRTLNLANTGPEGAERIRAMSLEYAQRTIPPVRVIMSAGRVVNPGAYAQVLPQVNAARERLDLRPRESRPINHNCEESCSGCAKPFARNQLRSWQSRPRPNGTSAVRLLLCQECNAAAERAEAITNRNVFNPTQPTATNQKGRTMEPSAVRAGRAQG